MLESQAAIADGFNANTQTDERKNISAPPHILARLDDSQKARMTWFLQGLSKAEMAQNVGVGVDVMMQNFAEMRKKLGVTDDCNLLCLVHGPADASKLNAAMKKYHLTQEEKKVLMLRLGGMSVLDISAGLHKKEAGDVMQEIFRKTGARTLQSLFDVVHNDREIVPQSSQAKINGNGHDYGIIVATTTEQVRPKSAPADKVPSAISQQSANDDEVIPAEIAEKLTPREIQIARYKLRGLKREEIADALHMSEHTVYAHIKSMNQKLEIHDQNAFFNAVYGDIYPKELSALAKHYGLTRAEENVMGHVLSGLSIEKAADAMKISKWTVQDHMRSFHQKMGVHTRAEIFFAAHDFIARECRPGKAPETPTEVLPEHAAGRQEDAAQVQIDLLYAAIDNHTPSAP